MMEKKYAVVVAGGRGERMTSTVPKQFLVLGGLPILMHTLKTFNEADPKIKLILVLPVSEILFWKQLCIQYDFQIDHLLIEGGTTRFHSVKNGLDQIDEAGLVAIHDGVRPLVSTKMIHEAFVTAEVHGNAIPALQITESLRHVANGKSTSLDRNHYFLVQTPQCFKSDLLKKAYDQTYVETFTDDASVVEAMGETIHLIKGARLNIKITTPEDLLIAEVYLKETNNN
jgi:2-C-methyl-D-erythritol 4-phosphate cytidylyltransferase